MKERGNAMRIRLGWLLGVGAMTVALVVGCSSEPPEGARVIGGETGLASPTSASPSANDTLTTSPAGTPTGDVERQLYDATEAFYTAVSKAYQTLDPAPIKPLVWPKTSAGAGYIDAIEDIRAKGYRFDGKPTLTISNFRLGKQDADPSSQTIHVTVTSSPTKTIDADGKIVDRSESGSSNATIQFMKMGERWLVISQRFDD